MLPAKPCLPTSAPCPPVGPEWLHEIKHDGYRMLAHHDGDRVRLISRRGLDWGWRFPTIVAAVKALAMRSGIVDGRADRVRRERARGRSSSWLKVKNPDAPAVRREREEDWGG